MRGALVVLIALALAGLAALAWFAGGDSGAGATPESGTEGEVLLPGTPGAGGSQAPRGEAAELGPARAAVEAQPERRSAAATGTGTGRTPGSTRQSLLGLVLTEAGPAAGAQVLLREGDEVLVETATDARGNFQVAPPRAVESGVLRVVVRGYAPLETGPHRIRAGEQRHLGNLRVSRGAVLGGMVTAPGGYALGDVEVRLHTSGLAAESNLDVQVTRTDDDGRFQFPNAPLGFVRLEARAEGYGERAVELRFAEGTGDVLLALAPERVLTVRVTDEEGAPLPGASLSLRAQDPAAPAVQGVTGEDGRAHLTGLGADRWQVQVTAHGYRPAVRNQVLADGGELEVQLAAYPCIAGRARCRDGSPPPPGSSAIPLLANARGSLAPAGNHEPTPLAPDGSFRICDMRPGIYMVEVRAPGFAPSRSNSVQLSLAQGAEGLDVILDPGGGLEIPLIGAGPTAEALEGATVRLYASPPPANLRWADAATADVALAPLHSVESRDGLASFGQLTPGSYWCLVRARDRIPATAGPFSVRTGTTTRAPAVALDAGSRIRGTVQDPLGRGVPGAFVMLFAEGGGAQDVGRAALQVRTDGEGRFDSPLIPAGTWRVDARASLGRPARIHVGTTTLLLGPDGDERAEITVRP